jgi:hypothetical protein
MEIAIKDFGDGGRPASARCSLLYGASADRPDAVFQKVLTGCFLDVCKPTLEVRYGLINRDFCTSSMLRSSVPLSGSLLHTLLAAATTLSVDSCGNNCGESLTISWLLSLLVKPLIGRLDFAG